jgi:hypothetical protein
MSSMFEKLLLAPQQGEKSHALFLSYEEKKITQQSYSRRKVLKFAIRLNNNNSSGSGFLSGRVLPTVSFSKKRRERDDLTPLPPRKTRRSQAGEGAEPTALSTERRDFRLLMLKAKSRSLLEE